MSITPQEADLTRAWPCEKMWQMFTRFEVEQAEPGVLGAKESFGKHLHLRGGATGQIQLMQARPEEIAGLQPEACISDSLWEWQGLREI
eukprot:Skav215762  [mRNA]  locus=scaffold106:320270:322650:- [translate_table: standard]